MNHRSLHSILFAAVVLVLSACGSSAPATTAPTAAPVATAAPTAAPEPTAAPTVAPVATSAAAEAPTGWKRFEVASEGFAVNLPANWEQVDVNRGELSQSVAEMLERNGASSEALKTQVQSMAAAGVKFFAFDTSAQGTSDGISTNINVIKQSLGAEIPLDAIEQANIQQLKDVLKVQNVESTRVTLPAGEAIKLVYQPEMQVTADQKIQTALTQYIIASGTDMYVVSLTSATGQAEAYAPIFEQIGQGFEIEK